MESAPALLRTARRPIRWGPCLSGGDITVLSSLSNNKYDDTPDGPILLSFVSVETLR
ncbi:hypothetical protein AArcS_1780 [Natranaeroarchaeum sulfidigenes]|uniref:Uncharacterized protein n=1 Tax=Natranaeroarchaeum sulfidigenes TaxID=2784880 RepID=A0A897MLD3_9EURY|nr:hypothetical protein AArcS_1780 [Natranaeroarchaeum sulfidigenes]